MRPAAEVARFYEKIHVENRGYKTPCFIWDARKRQGYGLFDLSRPRLQRAVTAHRYVYALRYGEEFLYAERSHDLDHLCRVRECVNIEHLEYVTSKVNRQRMQRDIKTDLCKPGRHERAVHERHHKDGRAFCSECAREADKRRRDRDRARRAVS